MSNQLTIPKIEGGLSKSEIVQVANQFVDGVIDGGNELEAAEAIAANENLIKEIKSIPKYVEAVRDAVSKHGKSYTTNSGARIEQCEVGYNFDFSQCNDPAHKALSEQLGLLKEAVKKRENFLKNVPIEGIKITDEETGEIFTCYRPSQTSTSSFKITLAK